MDYLCEVTLRCEPCAERIIRKAMTEFNFNANKTLNDSRAVTFFWTSINWNSNDDMFPEIIAIENAMRILNTKKGIPGYGYYCKIIGDMKGDVSELYNKMDLSYEIEI